MPDISRRAVLLGTLGGAAAFAAGGVAVAEGLLPGRRTLRRPLHLNGAAGTVPDVAPGRSVSGSFASTNRDGARTGWTIGYPPGHDGQRLRVLITLHGRSGDHTDTFGGSLHLDRFLADAVNRGAPPFAIASIDGGDHSYWHPRRDGDAAAMVLEEFLPLLEQHGLDVGSIGLLGWSMGGYGALYLAGRLGRERVAAVVAESPAIWHKADQSASGAFDDATDFNAHAIFGRLQLLSGIPIRLDCGASDGFAPVTRDLRAALSPTPAGGIEPGDHDAGYWRRMAPTQLRFLAAHLAT
jgi:S-formylglutathione hydrolase FrmB